MSDVTPVTLTLGTIAAVVSIPCWIIFWAGAWRMVQTIRLGQPDGTRLFPVWPRFKQLMIEFLAHTRMNKFRSVGWAHWLVMLGFLLGASAWLEAYGETYNPHFHWPIIGDLFIWSLLMEFLGVGTVVGITALIIIRQRNHPRRPDRMSRFSGSSFWQAYFVEAVVLIEGLGVVFVRASKYAVYGGNDIAYFATRWIAELLPAEPVLVSIFAMIKLFSGMIWLLIVGRYITMGVAWHRFSAFFNIYFKREDDGGVALGAAKPMMSGGKVLELEEADPETDAFGAGKAEDFSWKGLLDFTTCTECGRCQSQCPAWNTGKPLSPKLLILSLRDHTYAKAPYLLAGGRKDMAGEEIGLVDADGNPDEEALAKIPEAARIEAGRPLVGEITGDPATDGIIDPEVLWSCTTCGACVEQCPVDIEHVDHIIDMRRYQVLIESAFPSELAGLFKNLEVKGNPWGQNAKDRVKWIDEVDFDVPVYEGEFGDTEYLFWVGCAGAFEDRAKRTTKAVAELLHIAGVDFMVLGTGETCTGDSARRAGNELLFQTLAQQNIETFNDVFEGRAQAQRKIVVTCPHCYNAIGNEYPQLGGDFEVVHHTQLLNRLVRDKRLIPVNEPTKSLTTYHDPCYLGRHNKIYEAPRELVSASGATLTEMPRHGERSLCCGAGGARMWMEEHLGKRVNVERTDEALDTNAQKIATGCPFCRVMISDGVTARQESGKGEGVEVVDVAMMLLEGVKRGLPEGVTVGSKRSPARVAAASTAAPKASAAVEAEPKEAAPAAGGDAPAKPAATKAPAKGGLQVKATKRPGAKATPAEKPAATQGEAAKGEAEAPAKAPAKGGLQMKTAAKRPGAKAAAPAAKPAADKPAEPAAEKPAEAPSETKPEATQKEAPAKAPAKGGLQMKAAAKRPGAKAAAPAAKPAADKPAEAAAEKPAEAPSEAKPEATQKEAPAKAPAKGGLQMKAAAKRPGSQASATAKPDAEKAAPAKAAPEKPAQADEPKAAEPKDPEPKAAEPKPEPTPSEPAEPKAPAEAAGDSSDASSSEAAEKPAAADKPKPKGLGIQPGAKRPGQGAS
ncbi:heterodisulfide reductase-related iron-sulfur binding cluster [Lolliginicoccus suaedae]|uniref:heterodisulfide reductase-related iron-sulfur binding cluster n=1 Tax=Lolliginicoccus suaedae TaxID=2605429 RepID=UPI0011EEC360|nr:heterodisulfide reductase-related iron-sulfur binding cluster [Lolliginicoccus suaedae]